MDPRRRHEPEPPDWRFPTIAAVGALALFGTIFWTPPKPARAVAERRELWPERQPLEVQPDRYRLVAAPQSAPTVYGSDVGTFFESCADARAAGAAPIGVGEPGYRPKLDADRDGIACEPFRGR